MSNYPGGKNGSGVFHTIINRIPEHSIYFEFFAGSASIYFNKLPSSISFLCDASRLPIDHLLPKIRATDHAFIFDSVSNVRFWVAILNHFHASGLKVFCYLDPPYPMQSRSSSRPIYDFEMSDENHIALLRGLVPATFPIAISTYPNSIYSSFLSKWHVHSYVAATRKGPKKELLYMNYAMPAALHDYRYLGKNFRERESFSRIRKNLLKKLDNIPPLLLASIESIIAEKIGTPDKTLNQSKDE